MGAERLGVEYERRNDGAVVLRVRGRLEHTTAAVLEGVLRGLSDEGPPHVVLDLTGVDHIDSYGLDVLLETEANARRRRTGPRAGQLPASAGGVRGRRRVGPNRPRAPEQPPAPRRMPPTTRARRGRAARPPRTARPGRAEGRPAQPWLDRPGRGLGAWRAPCRGVGDGSTRERAGTASERTHGRDRGGWRQGREAPHRYPVARRPSGRAVELSTRGTRATRTAGPRWPGP